MDTQDALTKLDRLLRSRVPVIYLVSHEETRVIDSITRVAAQPVVGLSGEPILPAGRRVFTWSFTRGILPAHHRRLQDLAGDARLYSRDLAAELGAPARLDGNEAARSWAEGLLNAFDPMQTRDPVDALGRFGEYARADGTVAGMTDNASLLIACDLHRFLGDHDPLPIRALRDLAAELAATRSACIIVAPTLIPLGDAEKQIAVIDWPLPTPEELAGLVTRIAGQLPEHVPVHLNGDTDVLARAMAGLTAAEAQQALLQAVVATGALEVTSAAPVILEAKREAVRRSGCLEYISEQASAGDIGGLDLLKAETGELPRLFTAEAAAAHVEPPRGLLLVGVPGTGKSLTAKAIAGGRMPLLRFDVGAAMGSLVGQSEANVREALKIAEAVAPCVLWLDEIEKALGGAGGEMDGGTSTRVLGTILTWMQERTAPVLVMATANDVSSLRPELVNRFEQVWFVDLPGPAACAEILTIHARKRAQELSATDAERLGRQAAQMALNGREIEQAVKAALRTLFLNGAQGGLAQMLNSAIAATVPVSQTMDQEIVRLRAWSAGRARPASSREAASAPQSHTVMPDL